MFRQRMHITHEDRSLLGSRFGRPPFDLALRFYNARAVCCAVCCAVCRSARRLSCQKCSEYSGPPIPGPPGWKGKYSLRALAFLPASGPVKQQCWAATPAGFCCWRSRRRRRRRCCFEGAETPPLPPLPLQSAAAAAPPPPRRRRRRHRSGRCVVMTSVAQGHRARP